MAASITMNQVPLSSNRVVYRTVGHDDRSMGPFFFRACDVSVLHKAFAPERAFTDDNKAIELNHLKHAASCPDMQLQLLASKNHQLIVYRAESLIESADIHFHSWFYVVGAGSIEPSKSDVFIFAT
jgi:hypothetical protein